MTTGRVIRPMYCGGLEVYDRAINLSTSEVLMNLELTPWQIAAVKAELVASGEVLDLAGHQKTTLTFALLHELERAHVDYLNPTNYTRHNTQGAASPAFVMLHKVNPAAAKSFAEWHGQPTRWSTGYPTKCSCEARAAEKHADRMTVYAAKAAARLEESTTEEAV